MDRRIPALPPHHGAPAPPPALTGMQVAVAPTRIFDSVRQSMQLWRAADYAVALGVCGAPFMCCACLLCVCAWRRRARHGTGRDARAPGEKLGRSSFSPAHSVQMARLERKASSYKSFEDASDAKSAAPCDEWKKLSDDAGRPYWCNQRTGETSWEPPAETLPPGWEMLIDDSSQEPYWHNHQTGATSWEPPT